MLTGAITRLRGLSLFARELPPIVPNSPTSMPARISKFCIVRYTVPDTRDQVDTRSTERFVPQITETYLTIRSGRKLPAQIINLSARGVAVDADFAAIEKEEVVKVGLRRVKAGRSMLVGRVFVFEPPLREHASDPLIVL